MISVELHDLSRENFRHFQKGVFRKYRPMGASITRQQWEYQQAMLQDTGEAMGGMGEVSPASSSSVVTPVPVGCSKMEVVKRAIAGGMVGFVVAKHGVVPALVGLVAGYVLSLALVPLTSGGSNTSG